MPLRTLTDVVILCLLAGFAAAEEVYYDYAPVSWVEPVTRAEEHRRKPTCPPDEPRATEAADRGAGVTAMIAAMKSLVRSHDAPACNRSSPGPTHVVAYRVGYVYAGEEYVRVLDHDPGNRVRVRVSLEARP